MSPARVPSPARTVTVVAALAFSPITPHAAAESVWSWSTDGQVLGTAEGRRPEPGPAPGTFELHDAQRLVLLAGLGAEAWLGEPLHLAARLDTGDLSLDAEQGFLVSGYDLGDEARETGFIREAWAELRGGESTSVALHLGKRRLSLGEGLLLDAYALGGEVHLDHGSLSVAAGAALPGPELLPPGPPVVYARLDWGFAFLSRVGLLFAQYRGTGVELEEGIGEAVVTRIWRTRGQSGKAPLVVECLDPPPDTDVETQVSWLGAAGEWSFPGGQARAAWLTDFGTARTTTRLTNQRCLRVLERRGQPVAREVETDLLGHAVAGDARFRLGAFFPGVFGIWESGQSGSGGQDYTGFLAIASLPDRPALFFDVGAATSLRTDRAALAGIDGRGVLAGGPTLLYAPTETFQAELTLAVLFADAPHPKTGSRDYGHEADLSLDWDLSRQVTLFAEAATLSLGDFYPDLPATWHWSATLGAAWRYDARPAPFGGR